MSTRRWKDFSTVHAIGELCTAMKQNMSYTATYPKHNVHVTVTMPHMCLFVRVWGCNRSCKLQLTPSTQNVCTRTLHFCSTCTCTYPVLVHIIWIIQISTSVRKCLLLLSYLWIYLKKMVPWAWVGLGYRYIIAKAKAPLGMVEMGADIAIALYLWL